MTTTDLRQLLTGPKQVELLHDEQDPSHGLRLLLTDADTGEVGLLAIEPMLLVLPDEAVLDYSYQVMTEPPAPHFDECDYSVKTNVERDFPLDQLPF